MFTTTNFFSNLLRFSLYSCCFLLLNPVLSQTNYSNQGSIEWSKLTEEERQRIKNIPEQMLSNMNTEQLIEACVNTRYTLFLFAYNSLEDGFARFLNEYNGLQELLKRNDAVIHLINFYKNVNTNGYNPNWKSEKIGEYIHRIIVIEVLLSSDVILEGLSKPDIKILLNELLKKNNEKKSNMEIHSIFGLEKNAFTISKLIFNKGKSNGFQERIMKKEGLHSLLLNARLKEQKDVDDLVEIADDFLMKY